MVRNGYPEAQAYIFDWEISPETIQGREEELRQVSSGPKNPSMVSSKAVEAGSSSGTGSVDTRAGDIF